MMVKFYNWILRHMDNETGATAVEYGIMVALIAAAVIVTVTAVGTKLDSTFVKIKDALP